jgi:uncharacterized membrane-anchored protein
MSKSLLRQIILWLSMALMLGFPLYMIYRYQTHLQNGEVYRIMTRPIDPYNPFLARSIQLNVDDSFEFADASTRLEIGQIVYLKLEKDSTGYDHFAEMVVDKPERDYLRTQVRSVGPNTAWVEIPFEYYYLNEQLAPGAEELFRNREDSLPEMYVQIRVMDGEGIMEEVFVGEQTIVDYLLEVGE